MSFIDEFQDCFTETVLLQKKDKVKDELKGYKIEYVDSGTLKAFVDFVNSSEKNIADAYVGKEMIVVIGNASDISALNIKHNDAFVWNGKRYEVLPPDSNTSNQYQQGEIIAVYIGNIT